MRTITVATGKNAPNGFGIQKYDNNEGWNTLNGAAPTGVNATRWLRKTSPKTEDLSPLAAWLVENCPSYVADRMPAHKIEDRVRCYNGKTEAETMRAEFPGGLRHGVPVENFIKCYDLENVLTVIDDWFFDKIYFEETDEQYWNRQSLAMIAAGVKTVKIGNNEFEVK